MNLPRKARLRTRTGRKKCDEAAIHVEHRVRGRRQAPRSKHADGAEGLSPGVQYGEQADIDSKVLRIACDLEQRGCAGTEEQIVQQSFVLQHEPGELMWERKDEMKVGHRQQLGRAHSQPSGACVRLALGTMPVAARVIGMTWCPQPEHRSRCPLSAAVRQRTIASIIVRCCGARCNPCRARKLLPVARRMSATSRVGQLIASRAFSNASPPSLWKSKRLQRVWDGLQVTAQQMQIDCHMANLACPSSTWIIRRSAPASSKCVA